MSNRTRVRRRSVLGALGDGEFFDYGGGADASIPADQLDWSGDYAISPEGAMTGSSIYGNTGDSIDWKWGGDNQTVVASGASTSWFDPNAVFDFGKKYGGAAVDLYKRTQGGNPPPTSTPGAPRATTAVRTSSGFDVSKLALPVAAFFLLRALS